MNGEGFYGIGWAIRHGRLRTTATSIYEPMVGFDDVSNGPSMPLGEAEPIAPPEPPTPGPEELRIDDFDAWYR